MNTPIRLLATAVLGLAAGAAFAQSAPEQEGKLLTPGPFERVHIDGAGQVRIVQGERDEVFVAGDENARRGVDVGARNGTLHLDLPGGWKFWDSGRAQVEVRVKHLTGVTLSGAGDVYAAGTLNTDSLNVDVAGSGSVHFDDLRAKYLKFTISGSGEGQLGGRVEELKLNVSGRGKVVANQLQAGSANVSISGVGNADVWVSEALNVNISGAGHVRYTGTPQVKQSISGLGSVDAVGERR